MRVWRSLLFVPANQRRMIDKLSSLPADGFILDLEDTVPMSEKKAARSIVAEYFSKNTGNNTWIRCNPLTTDDLHEDLEAFAGTPGLAGFVLPKLESREDVAAVDRILADIEAGKSLPVGRIPIIAIIETALAVLEAHRIATGAKRVESLIYGGGEDGDMNLSLGATWSSAGPEMMLPRQLSVLSARAARIEYPMDGVYSNVKDLEGFERDTILSKRLGFCGRAVIHPSQIPIANRIYMPSEAEIEYYSRVQASFEAAVAQGIASITVDGKLVDASMAERAARVLELAKSIRAANGRIS